MLVLRNNAVIYAQKFIGQPYIWGGEGPGFDCSGFVQEILRSVGLDPKGDQTAQALYDKFKDKMLPTNTPELYQQGWLFFYGSSVQKISHVAMSINPYQIIEAGGGGSKNTSPEMAQKTSAFVRLRPISHRSSELLAICDPFMSF